MTEQHVDSEQKRSTGSAQGGAGESVAVGGSGLVDLAVRILGVDAGQRPDLPVTLGVMGLLSLLGILNLVQGAPLRSSLGSLSQGEASSGGGLEGLLTSLLQAKLASGGSGGSGGGKNLAALLPLLNMLTAGEGREAHAPVGSPGTSYPGPSPEEESRRPVEEGRRMGPPPEGRGGGYRERGFGVR